MPSTAVHAQVPCASTSSLVHAHVIACTMRSAVGARSTCAQLHTTVCQHILLSTRAGSQSAPVQLAGWTFFHGLDSLGGDVAWAWQHTGTPPQLARVASEMPGGS